MGIDVRPRVGQRERVLGWIDSGGRDAGQTRARLPPAIVPGIAPGSATAVASEAWGKGSPAAAPGAPFPGRAGAVRGSIGPFRRRPGRRRSPGPEPSRDPESTGLDGTGFILIAVFHENN